MDTVADNDVGAVESPVGGVTLAHVMPGRIRLRVNSVRGDADRAAEVEQLLSRLPFVDLATANPRSGSVVVEYSPEATDAIDVLGHLAAALDVEIEQHAPHRLYSLDSHLADRIRDVVRDANARVAERTGGIDLRLIVPGALFCLGVGAFLGARRRRMPAWHDLIWYAFNTFEMLNRPKEDKPDLTQE